jgi:hypothetical protein
MAGPGWDSSFPGWDSGPGWNSGPDLVFTIFPILFLLMFLVVIGGIIYSIFIAARNNSRNNQSPVLTVDAKIVAKRSDITHHHSNMNDNMDHMHTSTRYYVTFQVDSGDRMELQVSGTESGMLIEGDQGKLTFQGTRYLRFDRI